MAKGDVEETIDPVWIIVLSLIVITVMVLFFLYFRPGVKGGWVAGLFDFIKLLLSKAGI